jgi:flagellar hook-length control protein FliK
MLDLAAAVSAPASRAAPANGVDGPDGPSTGPSFEDQLRRATSEATSGPATGDSQHEGAADAPVNGATAGAATEDTNAATEEDPDDDSPGAEDVSTATNDAPGAQEPAIAAAAPPQQSDQVQSSDAAKMLEPLVAAGHGADADEPDSQSLAGTLLHRASRAMTEADTAPAAVPHGTGRSETINAVAPTDEALRSTEGFLQTPAEAKAAPQGEARQEVAPPRLAAPARPLDSSEGEVAIPLPASAAPDNSRSEGTSRRRGARAADPPADGSMAPRPNPAASPAAWGLSDETDGGPLAHPVLPDVASSQQDLANERSGTDTMGTDDDSAVEAAPLEPLPGSSAGVLPSGPREAAARHSIGPTSATASDYALSEAERARLVDRVVRAVGAADANGGVIRLRLSPPHLGSVRMEVSLRDGTLRARIEAETPQAQALLMEGLPALRERLASQDVNVERIDVELMNASGGGEARQSPFDGDAAPWSPPAAGQSGAPAADVAEPTAMATVGHGGRLNVVI